ncbi:MAG: hypothetical protein R3C45_12365, partial [Phycisphaerales bacterium]
MTLPNGLVCPVGVDPGCNTVPMSEHDQSLLTVIVEVASPNSSIHPLGMLAVPRNSSISTDIHHVGCL